ncbi:TetR family transcriptional regulator [Streptomyces justiciae]|uniref:TetR family transcriptional regulator n=1 Tax=Streptomyces justiciae TaxID=2780140 RepID=UPI00187FDF4E|nr:TetR family transcriptional regulator [Streptomyces justiciae]MBE8477373.1 TetR family transcriptional regulator [Streptomyces justiciae]
MSEFLRARRPEHKEQRRQAILDAARRLAVDSGVHNVTLSGVAAEVGLAKSNMSRYFGTREEMYLELASECWRDWGRAVVERLSTGDAVVATLTETLQARPMFCDLLGHTATSLEHNVSVPAASGHKRAMIVVIDELGDAIAAADRRLTEKEGRDLVMAAAGLAGAVYAAANPPSTLAEAYERNPELAAARPEFEPTLRRLLGAIAAGLPALRPHTASSAPS